MAAITIRVYTSPVLTASGNSGFFNLWQPFYLTYTAFTKGVLYVSGSGIAGDETLDLELRLAYSEGHALDGGVKVHVFPQLLVGNKTDVLIMPSGFSRTAYQETPIAPLWRLDWTIGGTAPSVSFVVDGVLQW